MSTAHCIPHCCSIFCSPRSWCPIMCSWWWRYRMVMGKQRSRLPASTRWPLSSQTCSRNPTGLYRYKAFITCAGSCSTFKNIFQWLYTTCLFAGGSRPSTKLPKLDKEQIQVPFLSIQLAWHNLAVWSTCTADFQEWKADVLFWPDEKWNATCTRRQTSLQSL